MNRDLEFQSFMSRYFPAFIAGFFLCCFTFAGAISLSFASYLHRYSADGNPMLITALVAGLVCAAGHIAVVRGRAWGVWVVVGVLVASVCVALPSYRYHPHPFSYGSTLFAGLFGLLVLNSKRYREMRKRLAGYRQQRLSKR
ncbi:MULTISPECIES: hypothetical protein [Pseudomonas]|jgi:hypothetical protein|uniref:Uncharacterized protein n=1 Tax=Pseudomonas mosselii TaxID=78327 RepID=A0A5R8Z863_9PSED|nr:hypothetical protein [Pseudomonas mosselii]TLP61910.1 hypothetical protein FEM01_10525 [Pseudomonas mosselii]